MVSFVSSEGKLHMFYKSYVCFENWKIEPWLQLKVFLFLLIWKSERFNFWALEVFFCNVLFWMFFIQSIIYRQLPLLPTSEVIFEISSKKISPLLRLPSKVFIFGCRYKNRNPIRANNKPFIEICANRKWGGVYW